MKTIELTTNKPFCCIIEYFCKTLKNSKRKFLIKNCIQDSFQQLEYVYVYIYLNIASHYTINLIIKFVIKLTLFWRNKDRNYIIAYNINYFMNLKHIPLYKM
jgi:hypothetical protein